MFQKYISKLRNLQDGKLITLQTPLLFYSFFARILAERIGSRRALSLPPFSGKAKNGYTLSITRASDLDSMLSLYCSIFNDPVEQSHFSKLYKLFPNLFYSIYSNKEFIGYAAYKLLPKLNIQASSLLGWDLWLYSIAVSQNSRGKGLGKWMLIETMSFFSNQSIEYINLFVEETNIQACALYKKLGFEEVSVHNTKPGNKKHLRIDLKIFKTLSL